MFPPTKQIVVFANQSQESPESCVFWGLLRIIYVLILSTSSNGLVTVRYFFVREKNLSNQNLSKPMYVVSKFRILKAETKTRNVSTHERNCCFCKSKSRIVHFPESCWSSNKLLHIWYYAFIRIIKNILQPVIFVSVKKIRQITTRQSPSSKEISKFDGSDKNQKCFLPRNKLWVVRANQS